MGSERYSFKIEFDKYDKTKSYYGLDKLCLNNIIQDNTYMKDYLTYRLMSEFGVNAPLCSYAYITVNGEDWGLYLAVEGIEEGFLNRCFGKDYGELYKPDSMSFGGGRGNGMNFKMSEFAANESENKAETEAGEENANIFPPFEIPESGFEFPENAAPPSSFGETPKNGAEAFENGFNGHGKPERGEMPEKGEFPESGEFPGKGGMFGMGSDDVKLKYTDDSYDSYPNIFDNAKTDITGADKDRLIASLKALSENTNIESAVDMDQVIRYFAVHNFVCNGDSYTGSMVHNYYLYEKDGVLSMIPWDYNLAFGTFQGGGASEQVNSPIDSPVSGEISDRPMISWIFSSDEYTELYHRYMSEFLDGADIASIIDEAFALISDYVEKDPTKFCTYEEFEKGVTALKLFCELRTKSVKGQLEGSIPSTSEGQSADGSTLIDASNLELSDIGTMNNGGMKGGGFGGFNGFGEGENTPNQNKGEWEDFGELSVPPAAPNGSPLPDFSDFSDGSDLPDKPNMPNIPDSSSGQDMPDMKKDISPLTA